MAISGLSVFGGGGITQYIGNGATAKLTQLSTNGVALDVQEKGVFSLIGGGFDLEITVDGVLFSGAATEVIGSLRGGSTSSGDRTTSIPYFKSLKVEVLNYSSGTLSINRISS